MNYLYLLDTNVISELIKNPRGTLYSKIQEVGEDTICTSIIVACESRFGAKKKNSPKLLEKLEIILEGSLLVISHDIDFLSRIQITSAFKIDNHRLQFPLY